MTDPTQWGNLTTGAWCYYNNDPANGIIYGKLYNWFAVNDPRGLAPVGWYIPSDAEWTMLTTFLGGTPIAGGKMKATGMLTSGTGLWVNPNTAATNSSGFTGLPAGTRSYTGGWGKVNIGFYGEWWSSTQSSFIQYAYGRYLKYNDGNVDDYDDLKGFGKSVRCLRD